MVASLGIFQYTKNRYEAVSPTTKKAVKYFAFVLAIFIGLFWLLWTIGELLLDFLGMIARNIWVLLFIALLIMIFVKNL